MSLDQKDFDMANGRYWLNDPYYYSAVNLDRDVPDYDPREREPEEDEDEDNDWEDLEDDTHDGGSHRSSADSEDWSGYHDDID
jgi:hypothetical protein